MDEVRKHVEETEIAGVAAASVGRHREAQSQSASAGCSEGAPQPTVMVSEAEAAVNVEQELLVTSRAVASFIFARPFAGDMQLCLALLSKQMNLCMWRQPSVRSGTQLYIRCQSPTHRA